MVKFSEIKEYIADCKKLVRQIKKYGDKLEFETWIYSGTLKISDEFMLDTPDISFAIIKYNIRLGNTRYRFTIRKEPVLMRYPKNVHLFDRLVAPTIFRACAKKYKEKGKQK